MLLDFLCDSRDRTIGWQNAQLVTMAMFKQRVHAWCRFLQQSQKTTLALFMHDSLDFASALLGAWYAGKTVALAADNLPATCAAMQVDGFLGDFAAGYEPLRCVPVHAADHNIRAWPPLAGDHLALVVYTSGSSGTPVAIPKYLHQLDAEVSTLECVWGARLGHASVLATVSHQHIYGLLFKLLWPLAAGRPVHAQQYAFIEELCAAVDAPANVIVASPAHLKRLPESLSVASCKLRALFCSGGPLPFAAVAECTEHFGQSPIEVFGSSETGGIAWRQRQASQNNEQWTALPNVQWRAVQGVLEVQSPHLPDTQWFRTQDKVSDDFVLQGRTDRIVKIEEKRISLDLLEQQLLRSNAVEAARVIVIAGQRQRTAAFVILTSEGRRFLEQHGKAKLNQQMREILAPSIETIALPRVWRYVDSFPLNAQGKTTVAQLHELLEGRIIEQGPTRAMIEITPSPDLIYFDGHFPGSPILPGVVQVDWVMQWARRSFALPPKFKGLQALKFQRVITPNMMFVLDLEHDPSTATVTFKARSAAGQHASGRILFGESDG